MNRTKQLRLAAGLTQVELAALAGLEQKRVSEVERRETLDTSTAGTVRKLAKALGVTFEELSGPAGKDGE